MGEEEEKDIGRRGEGNFVGQQDDFGERHEMHVSVIERYVSICIVFRVCTPNLCLCL